MKQKGWVAIGTNRANDSIEQCSSVNGGITGAEHEIKDEVDS